MSAVTPQSGLYGYRYNGQLCVQGVSEDDVLIMGNTAVSDFVTHALGKPFGHINEARARFIRLLRFCEVQRERPEWVPEGRADPELYLVLDGIAVFPLLRGVSGILVARTCVTPWRRKKCRPVVSCDGGGRFRRASHNPTGREP